MSIARTLHRSTEGEQLPDGWGRELIKGAVACSFFLVLLYFSAKGRHHVGLQVRLDEMNLVGEQLQQKLDDELRATEQLLFGLTGSAPNPGQESSPNDQVKALISTLKMRIGDFAAAGSVGELSPAESLEFRLNQAVLANAEHRFADALTLVTDQDGAAKRPGTETQIERFIRVLQTRGDSFYGLHRPQVALECYRQMLAQQPNRILTLSRVADCQYVLGNLKESSATYAELAKSYNHRGQAFLVQGKPGAALGDFEKAIGMLTWLIEQQGRSDLAPELASSHDYRGHALLIQGQTAAATADYEKAVEIHRRLFEQPGGSEQGIQLAISHIHLGNALLAQGKSGAAGGQYEKAIAIQTRFVEGQGQNELATELATSRNNFGNSLLGQQRLDAAIEQYEKAIEIESRLLGQEGQSELAMSYNDRGVVRRIQGKLQAALEDFEKAVKILISLIDQNGENELPTAKSMGSAPLRDPIKLDVAMGYAEKTIEVLPRTRLLGQDDRRALAVMLAMSLKNRGYARLAEGTLNRAVGDFKTAMEIYASLFEQEQQRDLAFSFARSLHPLAWIYATNPDPTVRNGLKAKEYALKACELTEWKGIVPLETLAAACAETGNFAEAVRWQEKALELASAAPKPELRSKLDLYKSGKPFRTPLR